MSGLPQDANGGPPGPKPTGTVSPASTSLTVSQTVQFTTSITGGVSWSIDPAVLGFISNDGLYASPSFITDTPQTVTVTATNSATSRPGIATVTLNPPVTPASVTMTANGIQQFSTLITGGVSWSISPSDAGKIDPMVGLYTAPPSVTQAQTVLVIATSNADGSQYTALVTLVGVASSLSSPTMISSLNPSSVAAGRTAFVLTLNGTGFGPDSIVKWNSSGLSTTFVNTTQVTALVPASLTSLTGSASVTVASVDGAVSNSATVTILTGPTIASVLSGASFASSAVAPGEIVSIFGSILTTGLAGTKRAAAFPLPTSLDGTFVTVNGILAPLLAIANVNGQEQINLQIPFEVAGQAMATIVVTNNGSATTGMSVPILTADPDIFTVDGQNGAVLHADGLSVVTGSMAAAKGETVALYATGLGTLMPQLATNQAASASPLSIIQAGCSVIVNGVQASVVFCGAAPGFVGLYQVNFTIPLNAASGSDDLVLRTGSQTSKTVKIAVQ